MISQQEKINQSLIALVLTPNDLSQISESYCSGEFDKKIRLETVSFENGEYYLG